MADPSPTGSSPNPATPKSVPRERILLADDDAFVRAALAGILRHYGYRLLEAADGLTALRLVFAEWPDLIILDVDMPGLDGLTVLTRLRAAGCTTPVLILSNKADVSDRVEGLDVGADDYLGKPFEADELLARIRALTRRHDRVVPRFCRQLPFGGTIVDLDRRVAERDGRTLRLSRIECSILELLARYESRPVSRALMMDVVWGYASLPNTRTVDTHIWRLRKKLGDVGDEPRWIKNIPGIGYQVTLGD